MFTTILHAFNYAHHTGFECLQQNYIHLILIKYTEFECLQQCGTQFWPIYRTLMFTAILNSLNFNTLLA